MAGLGATVGALGKVTAFVVRDGRPRRLLVFRHPLVGLQLPAGTVEPGESPVDAARREVAEETGVAVLDDAAVVDMQLRRLPAGEAIIVDTVRSRVAPDGSPGPVFQRGHRVELLERTAGTCRITQNEFDYISSPPRLVRSVTGWVPGDVLGSEFVRSFVLLRPHPATSMGRWTQNADGHDFAVFWAPLDAPLDLAGAQTEWLELLLRHLGGSEAAP